MTTEDWRRVADAVESRLAELRMDRSTLAKRASVDRKTVDNFLDRGMKPRTSKRGGYENAIGWGYGSMLVVARGGEPDVWPLDPVARLHEAARRMEQDIAEANSEGEGEIDRPSVGVDRDPDSYVATGAGGEAEVTEDEVLDALDEMRRTLDDLERRLRARHRP